MATGSFKLTRGLYAEVFVETSQCNGQSRIRISPDAFAWLKDVYGPDAWEWPVCDEYRAGAIAGCKHALRHTSKGQVGGINVMVTKIDAHPAHSSWDSVAYASCFAVWNALGDKGTEHPKFVSRRIENLERPDSPIDRDEQ
ncbi:MAG: hypothetical protein JXB30_06850 [Anaerolineae bacterium]|nr:hypothetical protein [Anaerolineae bacterium]